MLDAVVDHRHLTQRGDDDGAVALAHVEMDDLQTAVRGHGAGRGGRCGQKARVRARATAMRAAPERRVGGIGSPRVPESPRGAHRSAVEGLLRPSFDGAGEAPLADMMLSAARAAGPAISRTPGLILSDRPARRGLSVRAAVRAAMSVQSAMSGLRPGSPREYASSRGVPGAAKPQQRTDPIPEEERHANPPRT